MRFLVAILTLQIVAGVALGSPGGWKDMTEEDKSQEAFKDSLYAATAAYNREYLRQNGGDKLRIHSVSDAKQQVVAGMNYKFTAKLSGCDGNDCDSAECKFVVWYQAWRDERAKVQKIDC